ncbi:Elongation factor 1-alpha [Quillaja saponaria]|uniref:Elongation factor 1-alpha n=1 Tax=Quillaja saponaria TaxID=32244 RepID=A0AAD7P9I7_QUISA|nr:Elongation factor 1-alpha [Quillaja saponaria]KAJ7947216.1 Elongation factor 1-alpha [Quillaja saponaria]
MPHKVSHGLDYDEDYDEYDDYDYDIDIEENGEPEKDQETIRPVIWRCSICTYDNDDRMTACDICGVIRNPLIGSGTPSNNQAVEGMCQDSGASKMAKSLFASLPQQMPKKCVIIQKQCVDFMTEDGNSFHKLGNIQGPIHEFHEAFSTQSQHHANIAPFKFDVPSPDDVVSNGMHFSKKGSKANFDNFRTSRVSSSFTEKNSAPEVKSSTEKLGSSSSLMPKGKQDSLAESNHSKNVAANMKSSRQNSDSSSGSMPKGKHDSVNQTSNPKNSTVNIQSIEERLGSSTALPEVRYNVDEIKPSSSKVGKPQNLASNFNNISLDARSGSSYANAKGAGSNLSYKPEKWMLPQQTGDALNQLNLAIVGHVDSGKSTLSGRLLHLLGRISQKEMHKYEKEAKIQGKGSFAYAWALDESAEERERGITMTVAVAYFDSKRYHVVVLDSPGHKDFVPNMISGATQADAAILVIDASLGSFEAGLDSNKGQTREHAQLIRSFGVDQVIVAVNKMDAVAYSKDRFDLIKQQLGTFLRSCGFKDSSVFWIPLSAMENQNLVAAPSDGRLKAWYHGPYLLDAIDSLQPPARDFSKPLVMPICDVIKSPSLGQLSACGKLEAGALRNGTKVLVMPSAAIGTVRSLERDSQACTVARSGDNVAVTLQGVDGSHVTPGGVLCHPDFPVRVAKHLELKVLVLDITIPILIGSQLEFHIHHAKEAGRVLRILSVLDPKTGKVIKKSPRCLTAKQSAVLEVVLHGPVCVEEFINYKGLGRVFLRSSGRTIAVGIVNRIIEEQD